MTDVSTLQLQRHAPPPGWPPDVYERVTDALAAALVNAHKRDVARAERPA